MLNRKMSNYIFYASIAGIALIIFIARSLMLGNMTDKTTNVVTQSRFLQAQIDVLEEIVAENRDIQDAHLYDLYDRVPIMYKQSELSNYTIAQLELIGITEDEETQREVRIDDEPTFPTESEYSTLKEQFNIVRVEVYFNTMDVTEVDSFIDALYESEQVFIVSAIQYSTPDGVNYIGVSVDFLAFYAIENES